MPCSCNSASASATEADRGSGRLRLARDECPAARDVAHEALVLQTHQRLADRGPRLTRIWLSQELRDLVVAEVQLDPGDRGSALTAEPSLRALVALLEERMPRRRGGGLDGADEQVKGQRRHGDRVGLIFFGSAA